MPFEVRPIEGPSVKDVRTNTREDHRHPKTVAKEIEDFYTHAAEQGGRVIAGHTVKSPVISPPGEVHEGDETLYLVAELPENRPE
ncbi:MAG TPA: hypothetical protein VFX84_01120 [Candidatus Saccharimonadales bacterium]|nr:hypothetical protein [Candidatus Saccharimonadales bacterium]